MKQFIYNDRIYSELESLYKEHREDNLVTLYNFKKNVNDKGMSIEDALYSRDLTDSEIDRNGLINTGFSLDLFFAFVMYNMSSVIMGINYKSWNDLIFMYGFLIMGLIFTISFFRKITFKLKKGKRIKELEAIIAQEHKDIKAKIEQELKVI